jgi:hypothetical protein
MAFILMAQLLYGCGLRLMECVRLDQDLDFSRTKLSSEMARARKIASRYYRKATNLERHLRYVRLIYEDDLQDGFGNVYLPLLWSVNTQMS